MMPNPIPIVAEDLKLPPSMTLEQIDDNTFVLTIKRKSRIIMKDGRKLLEKIQKLWEQFPDARIEIRATAPICSKTRQYFIDKGLILGS